jgi:hypothetical protein
MNISKLLVTIFSGDEIVDIPTEGLEKTINNRIYPAISTYAVQICYTNKFLLYSY